MREIKFRAWDFNSYMHSWEDLQKVPHTALWTAEDIILMQYTGLKDKNGKEIYEGDYVCWWSCEYLDATNHDEHDDDCHSEGGVVEYDVQKACYCVRQWDSLYTIPYNRPLEVIGNIYENPKLLNS